MGNPSWYDSWPASAPDYSGHYQRVAPRQWPKGIYSSEGEAFKDQEAAGEILSWLRKGSWWISEHIWPWLDEAAQVAGTISDYLFIDRWQKAFGLGADALGNAILAAMRNRGTLTEAIVDAIFCPVFNTADPDNVSQVAPTPANTWAAAICWQKTPWTYDATIDLTACSGHDQYRVWCVGPANTIYQWAYGVSDWAWNSYASGTANTLNDVYAFPEDRDCAFAVGAAGTVRQWDGAAWGALAGAPAQPLNGVWCTERYYNTTATDWKPRYVWVCGDNQVISRYDHKNAAWTNWTPGAAGDHWQDIHALNHDNAVACSSTGKIAIWAGASWSVVTVDNAVSFYGVRVLDDGYIFMVGSGGEIYYWNTSAWQSMVSGTSEDLLSIDGWEAERLVVVGDAGTCLRYTGYENNTWEAIQTNCWEDLKSVWCDIRSPFLHACGDNGWTLATPPKVGGTMNDEAFMLNQNIMHIYSTAQTLDPDYAAGRDACVRCQPAWGQWSVGRRRTLRASDSASASGASNSCAS
jgi:hypothetical protein